MAKRPLTIRESLIRGFAPVVLVVALAAFALIVLAGRFAVRTLSSAIIEQTHERVVERLDAFFQPVLIEMDELSADVETGALDMDDDDALHTRFARIVSSVPHVSAGLLARPDGREVMALREDDVWVSHVIPGDSQPGVQKTWTRAEADDPRVSELPAGRDPRERPWYTAAEEAGGALTWTEPYLFYTSQRYGVTVSRWVIDENGRAAVLALDVMLHELDEFTRTLELRRGGLVYLLDGDGRVLGLPAAQEFDDAEVRLAALLQPVESIGNRLALDTENAYVRILDEEGVEEWDQPFRFTSRGQSYWGRVVRRGFARGLVLMPAIIVSEKDLLGPITAARWVSLGIGLLAIGWALWKCVRLASRFSGPIEALADESDRIIRGGRTVDHEPVRSSVVELAKLSSSQIEMRLAMKTLGKMERDLQVAREIQQALLPDELPVLDGWSFGAWNEPADETGGDVYDLARLRGNGQVFLLLADATGHGVGPAISAAQVSAMARMGLRAGAELPRLLRDINAQLHEDLPGGRFITLWAARLDSVSGELSTLSAGQAPLLRYSARDDRFEVADADAVPLGVVAELDDLNANIHPLEAGDLYAVFSDGIYEARSPEGEQFGVGRTQEALRAARDGTAQDAISSVREAVERFTHGAPAEDDRTGVVVKRMG